MRYQKIGEPEADYGVKIATHGLLRPTWTFTRIAADHLLSLIEAELAWVERALRTLGHVQRR